MTWRGNGKNKTEVHPAQHVVVQQFFEIASRQRRTLQGIAKEAGLCKVSMGKWKTKHVPTLANFEAALNCVGYTLKIEPLPKLVEQNMPEPACLFEHYLVGF